MKFNAIAQTAVVTTFAFTPSYYQPIESITGDYSNETDTPSMTDEFFVDLKGQLSEKIRSFLESQQINLTDVSFSVEKFEDDIDFVYITLTSETEDIESLFRMERQLNQVALEKDLNYIFTVGG